MYAIRFFSSDSGSRDSTWLIEQTDVQRDQPIAHENSQVLTRDVTCSLLFIFTYIYSMMVCATTECPSPLKPVPDPI